MGLSPLPLLNCHCEDGIHVRSNLISLEGDCFGAALLAMTLLDRLGKPETYRSSPRVEVQRRSRSFFGTRWGPTPLRYAPGMITLARVLEGLGTGLLMPSYNSLISKVVPEDKRGLVFGFFGTSLGILTLPLPWIGAQLWEQFTPQTSFWITATICIVTVPIAWVKFVLPKQNGAEMINDPEIIGTII